MQEPLDVQGIWWLPGSPDHKVHGWFSWDPEEGGTLRLAGTLRPQAWVENALPDGHVQRYLERPSAKTSNIRASMDSPASTSSTWRVRSKRASALDSAARTTQPRRSTSTG